MADYESPDFGGGADLPTVAPNALQPYSPLNLPSAGPMPSLPALPRADVASSPMMDIGRMLMGFAAGTQGRMNPIMQYEEEQRARQMNQQLALAQLAMTDRARIVQEAQLKVAEARETRQEQTAVEKLAQDKRDALIKVYKDLGDSASPDARLFAGQGYEQIIKDSGQPVPPGLAESFRSKPLDTKAMQNAAPLLLSGVPVEEVALSQGVSVPQLTALHKALLNGDATITKILTGKTPNELRLDELKVQEAEQEIVLKDLKIKDPGTSKEVIDAALQIPGPDGKRGHRLIDLPPAYRAQAADRAIANGLARAAAGVANQPVQPQQITDMTTVERFAGEANKALGILTNPKKAAVVEPFIGPTTASFAGVRRWVQTQGPESLAGGPVPQELIVLKTGIAAVYNIEAKIRAGSAVTAPEERRLLGELPSMEQDKKEVLISKLKSWARYATVLDERTKRYMSIAGREALTADAQNLLKARLIREVSFEPERVQLKEEGWGPPPGKP